MGNINFGIKLIPLPPLNLNLILIFQKLLMLNPTSVLNQPLSKIYPSPLGHNEIQEIGSEIEPTIDVDSLDSLTPQNESEVRTHI